MIDADDVGVPTLDTVQPVAVPPNVKSLVVSPYAASLKLKPNESVLEVVGDVGTDEPTTEIRVPFTKIALRDANELAPAVDGSVSVALFSLLSFIVPPPLANAVVLW